MVYNPILTPIRACGEAGVPHAVSLRRWVLVENATLSILAPVLNVHWVIANQLELTKTVVAVVGSRCGVDDKVLTGLGVDELLRGFIRGESHVEGTPLRCLFSSLVWDAQDLALGEVGGDSPRVVH